MGDGEKRGRRAKRPARVGRTGARFPSFDDVEEAAEPAIVSSDEPVAEVAAPVEESEAVEAGEAAEPVDEHVGQTGARFPSASRRERRDAERRAAEDAAVPAPAVRAPDPEPDDSPTVRIPRVQLEFEDTRTRVRPYVRTQGRTRTRSDLAVETLVSIPSPRPTIEDPEHAAIDDVCDGPRSVAEVAARLEVPLGVARVLIDDMAAAGLLVVHATASRDGAPPLDIMRRVLEGLHRL